MTWIIILSFERVLRLVYGCDLTCQFNAFSLVFCSRFACVLIVFTVAFWLCLHLRFQAISLAFCSRLYLRLDMFSPAILIAISVAILPFCFCVSTCIFASNFYAVVIAFIHRMIVWSPRLNKIALGDYALFIWIFKRGC